MKKIAFLVTFTLCFSLSAHAKTRDATQKELALIKIAVAEHLKDPDSLKLKDVKLAPTEDGTGFTLCGEVNAKNSYGGYTGFSKFRGLYFSAGTDGKPVAMVLRIDSDEDSVAATLCQKEGI